MNLQSTVRDGYTIYYRNAREFKWIYKEVFVDEEYAFTSKHSAPYILDCGSHIGLSILYFKKKYPQATIVGFEPNPENFLILQKNIQANKLHNVSVIHGAVSDRTGKTNLYSSPISDGSWTWGDSIVSQHGNAGDIYRQVKTYRLSTYITQRVDFLKLDIEGSEQSVLLEIRDKLSQVSQMVAEFHYTKENQDSNNFGVIKNLLEEHGFHVRITSKDIKMILPAIFWRYPIGNWIGTVKATR